MTRPWLIWLLSLLCAAGIFGAMGVITHRSLNLEREWAQARADAELQERLRLALWRMETEASTLMIDENNRPPEHFRAAQKGRKSDSPLGDALPEHVRLHFEIAPDRTVMSPQVQRAGDPQFQVAERNLARLRELLARPAGAQICSCITPVPAAPQALLLSNATFIDAAARNKGPFEWSGGTSTGQNGLSLNVAQSTLVLNSTVQQGQMLEVPAAEAMKQSALNTLEMNRRAQVYTKSVEEKGQMKGPSSSVPPAKKQEEKPVPPKPETKKTKKAAPAPGSSPQVTAPASSLTSDPQATGSRGSPPGDAAGQNFVEVAPPQRVTPFSPFWLENELFLVREVLEPGKRFVQGVWLDADSLRTSLLEAVVDLLPHAALVPVASVRFKPVAEAGLVSAPVVSSGDPMELIGFPWKLVPGVTPLAAIQGWTPMRLTLAAAWFAALLAVVAAAALLFGVTRLSERRAAFVSSVTHELRTPLTTFRLYSELLEQGMVREEADRTQYLHTLRAEAERLTHLVDNVLAYSRIERTHRRSRMERVELAPWLDRIRGRLEDRAREAGMNLGVSLTEAEGDLACVTDATALEQIVFNLVDNACKYAAGRCTEPIVRLTMERAGRWVMLRVCDSGPGISRRERSRLFRPFHKSADEAANSKPGVGLGLALCHRLAKALGGKLTLERPAGSGAGACFVLRLPAA